MHHLFDKGLAVIEYTIGQSAQILVITDIVLSHLRKKQQRHLWSREAGGQLFATLNGNTITVTDATGPRKTDKRNRHSYIPDRLLEQEEITDFYSRGFHYIGDWHTHPQESPVPSDVDRQNLAEMVQLSKHDLNGFLMLIIGVGEIPNSIYATISNGTKFLRLNPNV